MTQLVILCSLIIFTSCGMVKSGKDNRKDWTEVKPDSTKQQGDKNPDDKQPVDKDMPGYSKNHKTVTEYELKDDETVIDAGKNMEWVFGRDYKPWTPDDIDVGNAEEMIKKCFDDQSMGTVNRVLNRKPSDYCKQFVGAVNSNGERVLWINMFCKKELDIFKDWKDKIVYVNDGGNCFIQITFHWDKNDGHYIMKVNGNA